MPGIGGNQDPKPCLWRVVGGFRIRHIPLITDQTIFVAHHPVMLAEDEEYWNPDRSRWRGGCRRRIKQRHSSSKLSSRYSVLEPLIKSDHIGVCSRGPIEEGGSRAGSERQVARVQTRRREFRVSHSGVGTLECQREPRRFDRVQESGQNESIDIPGYRGLEPAIESAERVADPNDAGERVTTDLAGPQLLHHLAQCLSSVLDRR